MGRGIQITNIDQAFRFAECAVQSGLAPKGMNPQAVVVAIELGMELGLPPMAAIQNIAVINGRATVWGDMMLAICQNCPEFDWDAWEESISGEGDKMEAKCVAKRKSSRKTITRTFSVTDAKMANLWGKAGPWQQYPKRMLQMRARSFCLRDSFSDALKGMYAREEVEDFEPRQVAAVVTSTQRVDGLAESHGVKEKPVVAAAAATSPTETPPAKATRAPRMPKPEAPAPQPDPIPESPPNQSQSDEDLAAEQEAIDAARALEESPSAPSEPSEPSDPVHVTDLIQHLSDKWDISVGDARKTLNDKAMRSSAKVPVGQLSVLQVKGFRHLIDGGGWPKPTK